LTPPEIKFLEARDLRRGRRDPKTGGVAPIRNVVIHTAEIGESLSGAEALMRACAAGYPRPASWHYAVDADSITQSVREEDTAFHAPGLSHCSIGIEHAGRARQTAEEWQDEFSIRMLELSAWLVARICWTHRVPVIWCAPPELFAGAAGITGHVDVSRAFQRSNHWDPGPNFPREHYLGRVLHHYRARDTDPSPPPSSSVAPPLNAATLPVLRYGATGDHVRLLQERLVHHARPVAVDGHFGHHTSAAVHDFQAARGLMVDSVVGPATWLELLR
jgi:N-acetyl-anhydromuramyl-L-alanine amidase AmpD